MKIGNSSWTGYIKSYLKTKIWFKNLTLRDAKILTRWWNNNTFANYEYRCSFYTKNKKRNRYEILQTKREWE
jgi:hypothetical protein